MEKSSSSSSKTLKAVATKLVGCLPKNTKRLVSNAYTPKREKRSVCFGCSVFVKKRTCRLRTLVRPCGCRGVPVSSFTKLFTLRERCVRNVLEQLVGFRSWSPSTRGEVEVFRQQEGRHRSFDYYFATVCRSRNIGDKGDTSALTSVQVWSQVLFANQAGKTVPRTIFICLGMYAIIFSTDTGSSVCPFSFASTTVGFGLFANFRLSVLETK